MPGARLPMRKIRDVLRLSAAGLSTGRAVDMLDNAVALPTCPQRQQPQKPFAMEG